MPATVFTAGDNQYPWEQIEDYQDPNGYSGTWGRPPRVGVRPGQPVHPSWTVR